MNQPAESDTRKRRHWGLLLPACIPIVLVYWFTFVFRAEFGSWPDSAQDWVPLDRGGHDELIGFAAIAAFSVVIGFLAMLLCSLVVLVRVAILRKSISANQLAAYACSWGIFGLFLLFGGWRFLTWMLD